MPGLVVLAVANRHHAQDRIVCEKGPRLQVTQTAKKRQQAPNAMACGGSS